MMKPAAGCSVWKARLMRSPSGGDEATPKAFREELEAGEGDITVWINSPGGNVFAAAEIYTMLRDYKGAVTVKIDAIAASAASV